MAGVLKEKRERERLWCDSLTLSWISTPQSGLDTRDPVLCSSTSSTGTAGDGVQFINTSDTHFRQRMELSCCTSFFLPLNKRKCM